MIYNNIYYIISINLVIIIIYAVAFYSYVDGVCNCYSCVFFVVDFSL